MADEKKKSKDSPLLQPPALPKPSIATNADDLVNKKLLELRQQKEVEILKSGKREKARQLELRESPFSPSSAAPSRKSIAPRSKGPAWQFPVPPPAQPKIPVPPAQKNVSAQQSLATVPSQAPNSLFPNDSIISNRSGASRGESVLIKNTEQPQASLQEAGKNAGSIFIFKGFSFISNFLKPTDETKAVASESVIWDPKTRSMVSMQVGELEKEEDEEKRKQRLNKRPIAIVREAGSQGFGDIDNLTKSQILSQSLLNVVHAAKDEAQYITIIPADEAKVLETELKQWSFHRLIFYILFGFTFSIGITIVGLTIYTSRHLYLLKESTTAGSALFVLHADLMIISTVFLSAIGITVFRLLGGYERYKVIRIHVAIFIAIYALFLQAFVVAFTMHEQVTGQNRHMYTLHAMVGVMILGFMTWEGITGTYITFRPKAPIKKYHGPVGMTTFMLCGACCGSGYLVRAMIVSGKLYDISTISNISTDATGVMIITFCCLVRYIATEFKFRRRPRPEWDEVFARNVTPAENTNIDLEGSTLQQYVRRNLTVRLSPSPN